MSHLNRLIGRKKLFRNWRKKLSKAVRNPHLVPRYSWWFLTNELPRRREESSRGYTVFNEKNTVGVSEPSKFSARIFEEVKLLEAVLEDNCERSLEIGCGYGRITPWIAGFSREHHAVEPNQELLELAEELYPQVSYENCMAQDMPYEDGSFDLSVSFNVLGVIPPDRLEEAVEELKRVTAKGGRIVLKERVSGRDYARSWSRSIEKWGEIFRPWTLENKIGDKERYPRGLDKGKQLMVFSHTG